MLRFLVRSPRPSDDDAAPDSEVWGPCTVEEVVALVKSGSVGPHTMLGDVATGRWAAAVDWAPLRDAVRTSLTDPSPSVRRLGPASGSAGSGPSRSELEREWYRDEGFAEPETLETSDVPPSSPSAGGERLCNVCRETIPADSFICPECGEPPSSPGELGPASAAAPSSYAASVADVAGKGWFALHWRPAVTMSVIGLVLAAGIALRHLAPDRYTPPKHFQPPPAAAPCDEPCWHGEACQVGRCEWLAPNDVGHVAAEPLVAGPFQLPQDLVDVLPLDAERFAVSCMRGVEIYAARSGELLSLVSDAPQAQSLYRVGPVVYATSPERIHVIDVETTRVLKSIEIGSPVHDLHVGAGGQRVVASVPGALSVVVIATEYHAEVNRFFFGDDAVGPVAIDDMGSRGLATTGRSPLAGQRGFQGGALYAFDPSRLASAQDRVRTAMMGNPVQVVMAQDGASSFVVLREQNAVVPLKTLASSAVLRAEPIATCRKPEQLEMVPVGRRGIVRCSEGQALEVFDLPHRELLRHIPLHAGASDMVVTPDSRQAIVVLPYDRAGVVGLLDLQSYELTLTELAAEPRRVRITPDGHAAVVISDRTKVAWVLR